MLTTKSKDFDQNIQSFTRNYSIPPVSEDQLKLWLQMEPEFSSIYMEDYGIHDHISVFQPEKEDHPIKNSSSSSEDVFLHGFDKNAQSRNISRNNNNNINNNDNMQTIKSSHGKEGCVIGEECKRNKRPRSTEVHNLNERLRRRKLNEKMTILQEMIPNSVKRDQASTIDDAIKYIKNLQCLVQMMSTEAGHTLCHSPMMMMSPHEHRGMKFPNLIPLPQTTCGNDTCLGMPIGYPGGLFNPWLFPLSGTGLGLQLINNNLRQFTNPIHANTVSCTGSRPSTAGAGGEASPSQGATR